MSDELTDTEYTYLLAIAYEPFYPVGWLYRSIYTDLQDKGWCYDNGLGFVLTNYGKECFEKAYAVRHPPVVAP